MASPPIASKLLIELLEAGTKKAPAQRLPPAGPIIPPPRSRPGVAPQGPAPIQRPPRGADVGPRPAPAGLPPAQVIDRSVVAPRSGYKTPAQMAAAVAAAGGLAASTPQAQKAEIDKLYADNGVALAEQKAQAAAESGVSVEDLEKQAKATIVDSVPVWTKDDRDWLDKLDSTMDLTTFGLALMANNDGSMGIAQSIGVAMQAARGATKSTKELARRTDIQEREIASREKTAEAAYTSSLARVMTAMKSGRTFKKPGKSELAVTQSALTQLTGNPINTDHPAEAMIVSALADLEAIEIQGRGPLSIEERSALHRRFFQENPQLVNDDMFGAGDFTIDEGGLESTVRGTNQPAVSDKRSQLQAQLEAALQER